MAIILNSTPTMLSLCWYLSLLAFV